MHDKVSTTKSTSHIGNPNVMIKIGNSTVSLSIVEAKQFALAILSTAELSRLEHDVATFLDTRVGREETKLIISQLERAVDEY